MKWHLESNKVFCCDAFKNCFTLKPINLFVPLRKKSGPPLKKSCGRPWNCLTFSVEYKPDYFIRVCQSEYANKIPLKCVKFFQRPFPH